MSQALILALMRELGGRATSSEIVELAKKKYPDLSLHQYVGTRLTKMYEWGDIGFNDEIRDGKKKRVWFIVEHPKEEATADDGQAIQIVYSCGVCRATFGSQSALHSHQTKSH